MSTSFFEIVVVGTDLSGLVLAATAAKRGYRVLVVGHGHRDNAYDYRGYRFYRRPHLFNGLAASPAAEAVLVELGLNIELRNRLQPVRPRYQLVTPTHRLDFDADPTVLARELEREFPGQLQAAERYLRSMAEDNASLQAVLEEGPPVPPEGMFERRAYRKAVAAIEHLQRPGVGALDVFPKGHPVRALMAAPVSFLGPPALDEAGAIPWTRAAVHAAQGFHLLSGGLDRLRAMFLEKVTAHCGSFRPDAYIDEMEIRRGKVRSVTLRRSGDQIGCKLVVCNGDPKRFFQLVPHEHQKERFHNTIRSLQPSHYLATLNFALSGETVQEGMCPVVFQIPEPNAALEHDNLLAVTTDPKVYGTEEGTAHRIVTAACRVPLRTFSPRVEFARELKVKMLRHLSSLVPFLDERLLASHLTWLPANGDQRELDMGEVTPLYAAAIENSLDASPVGAVSGYKNILVGGDSLLPGFGLEGAFMGGAALLRHATRLVVLKSLLHD